MTEFLFRLWGSPDYGHKETKYNSQLEAHDMALSREGGTSLILG